MEVKKRITAKEFVALGLLHEVNRRMLHPLGLALEVVESDGGAVRFGEVWDFRDDPEGISFDVLDEGKIEHVKNMEEDKRAERIDLMGYWIQGEKGGVE